MNERVKMDARGKVSSILPAPDLRSGAAWLASAPPDVVESFLESLSDDVLAALPWLFEFWALPHQLPPEGDWRAWVVLGGRGAGKTRAGAEWVRAQVEGARPLESGRASRVALVGETYDQVRDVMVFGESGLLACSPPDRVPTWQATRRRLVWPNGAVAQCFSASEPEGLRGPQFDAAWVDELAKWKKGQETWDMLQFALRLGERPQAVVTTTPRNVDVLKALLARPSTVQTHAPTEANRAYLAASFLQEVRARYGQTRLGRQELDGVLLEDTEGALWTHAELEASRVHEVPVFERVIVAVDPAVSRGARADTCGIVAVGITGGETPRDWQAYVLEDASVRGASPQDWASRVIELAETHHADRVVAEVNQGGDLVGDLLRQIDPSVSYMPVHASKSKGARAEPVAALYEQGRVKHIGVFDALEDQMVQMTAMGFQGQGSPDRVDALVWAIFAGLIQPARAWRAPRIRLL